MMEKEEVLSFSGVETGLIKEAIHQVVHLYTEEVMRQMLVIGTPVENVRGYASQAFSFTAKLSPYLIGNREAVTKIWDELRTSTHVFEAVVRTAVKLRGMYSAEDWGSIVARQAAAISMFALRNTVADETVKEHFNNTNANTAEEILNGNPWLVTLLLLNYMPVASLPPTIQTALASITPNSAQRQGVQ